MTRLGPPATVSFLAYAVHGLTASGIVFALLAALELLAPQPDPRRVLMWLAIAMLIDAVDGPLARRARTRDNAWAIDGRTIDDILDYLTCTFVPLLLVLRMSWTSGPGWLGVTAVALAMFTSLFGFSHRHAKDASGGFFRGFPSYWHIMSYYFGLWVAYFGDLGRALTTVLIFALSILTLLPVRFIYPNMAPPKYKVPLLVGAAAWGLTILLTLPWYPGSGDLGVPEALMWASLLYPLWYVIASVRLQRRTNL